MADWEDVGSVGEDGWEDVSPKKEKKEASRLNKLGQAGTALADIIGGAIGMVAGPAIGGARTLLTDATAEEGLETSRKIMDALTPSKVIEKHVGIDMPNEGEVYENAMTPFEWMSKGISATAGGMAELYQGTIPGYKEEELPNTAAAIELGMLGGMAGAGVRGAKKMKDKAAVVEDSVDKIKGKGWEDVGTVSLEQAVKEADAVNPARSEIVPDVVSEVNPARDRAMERRQMELNLDEQPVLNVDRQGQVFKGDVTDPVAFENARRLEEQAKLEQQMQGRQGTLFDDTMEGTASPFEPNRLAKAADEVAADPRLARRQMELQLDQADPLYVDRAGRAGKELSTLIDESPEQVAMAKAAAEARARGLRTEEAMAKGKTGTLWDKEPFQEIKGEAIPNQPDFFATKATEARVMEQAVTNIVKEHPLVRAAERAVDKAIETFEALKAANADAKAVQKAQREVAIAKAKAEATTKNVAKSTTTKRPRSMAHRKQGGGATTDFLSGGLIGAIQRWKNKQPETVKGERQQAPLKNIPGVKERLKDYVPELRSMDEIRAEAATRPDVDQNWVQRSINQLTAGGLYQSLKTQNIVVKKTFETVSNAFDRAQQLSREFIQGDLLPKMRDLNSREKGEIWAKMMLHEGKETLTREQLLRDGFNERQVAMYESYRNAAEYALKAINEARAVAGKKPIDARTGYVAGVFSGDFRRVIYNTVDGKKTVVGVIGNNFRPALNKMVKEIKERHPEWEIGEEKYMGGTGRSPGERQKAFEAALEMLGENDPNMQKLVQTYHESMTKDAYNYLNQKKHTKQKKGVMGSEGMKEWQSIEKNAQEGMKAQVKYLENSYKWAELSKAQKELAPMLSDPNINMPNAKDWANKYLDRALGISDNDFSKSVDTLLDGVAKSVGIGPSLIGDATGIAKNVVSKTLLGFANIPFLLINSIQPIVGVPTVYAQLLGRGINPGLGMFKATSMLYDAARGKQQTGFNKQLMDFAKERGISSSEIFDHSMAINKDVPYYVDKVAEVGIPQVEKHTRAATFYTIAHMLKEGGLKVEDGLFETAQKFTNQVMTDYRAIEIPPIYSSLGPAGHLAANLVRFKHNQLSALAQYVREIPNNRNYAPLTVALATNVATAGILGMIGFKEADALYTMIMQKLGKPDTLTNLVLKNTDTLYAHGMFSAATGIDWSNRLGLQDVVPNSIAEAAFPGGGRAADAIAAIPDLFGTDADRMRAAREFVPNSVRGAIDRTFFEDEQGRSINPKTLEPIVQRTERDQLAKTFGLTGVKESDTKAKLFQQRLIDTQMADLRKSALKTILDDLYTKGQPNQEAMQKYLDAEGDPTTLANAIEKARVNAHMTEYQRRLLATSAAGSVNAAHRLKRLKEAGIE